MNHNATPELLRSLFNYSAETGLLTWKSLPSTLVNAGAPVSYVNKDGYVQVQVKGRKLLAHRVAWAIHFGEWPTGVIDHVNGDRTDNRIANLRDATHRLNAENRRATNPNSKSGLLGAHVRRDSQWRAEIMVNGKRHRLGDFSTPKEAHQAYLVAKRRLHAGCTI